MKSNKYKIKRRFLSIASLFLKLLMDFTKEYGLIKRHGYPYAQKKMRSRHERRARQFYSLAINLGGVMIKLCQFFSARRDFFPESYIRVLSSLQDNVPSIPFCEIEEVLQAEYSDYRKIFISINPDSLASASLGQVHRAVLFDGTEVVLKILKPNVERIIDTDFAILDSVFKLLANFKVFKERVDIFNVLDEFIKVTGDELNFRREVYIAKKFLHHFADFNYIHIPAIYEQYCTNRIIVMEYLEGNKVSDLHLWKGRNNDPVIISRRIIELYVEQLLNFGTVHFDPHPGNILVTSDNRFILVDFGMSGIITEKMKKGLTKALRAFIDRDYRTILDVLDELGFIRRGINRYSLLNITEYFLSDILEVLRFDRESIQTVDLAPIRDELIEILYLQPFNIPFEWAFIGKAIGIISGITATLNPDFNVYDELKPFAEKYLKQNIFTMTEESLQRMKSGFDLLIRFPSRIDTFLGNIERGNFRFKVDYSEMIDKIDEVKIFVIRLTSFLISVVSFISSYIFWISRDFAISRLFITIGIISILMTIFYSKRTKKEKMKKYF